MASREGLSGGVIYDALVAATVLHAGARLVTRDRRIAVRPAVDPGQPSGTDPTLEIRGPARTSPRRGGS